MIENSDIVATGEQMICGNKRTFYSARSVTNTRQYKYYFHVTQSQATFLKAECVVPLFDALRTKASRQNFKPNECSQIPHLQSSDHVEPFKQAVPRMLADACL